MQKIILSVSLLIFTGQIAWIRFRPKVCKGAVFLFNLHD